MLRQIIRKQVLYIYHRAMSNNNPTHSPF